MEDKITTQQDRWTYKYLGTIPADELHLMMVDVEVTRTVPLQVINKINNILKDVKEIRIFFSETFNSFEIEPITLEVE